MDYYTVKAPDINNGVSPKAYQAGGGASLWNGIMPGKK